MNINEALDSVILKRDDESPHEEDDFIPPPRPKRDDDTEMDITPMIDITFLLLIFFLVTSRPDQATGVNLPLAIHGDVVSQRRSTVMTIAEGGIDQAPVYRGDGKNPANLCSNDVEKRNEEIKNYIEEGMLKDKTDIVIKADRGVPCRQVDDVMQAVSKVDGVTRIHLGVLDNS
jgi:biopolymer transport protein ExbD